MQVPKMKWHFTHYTVSGTNPKTNREKKEYVTVCGKDIERAKEKSGLINITDVTAAHKILCK